MFTSFEVFELKSDRINFCSSRVGQFKSVRCLCDWFEALSLGVVSFKELQEMMPCDYLCNFIFYVFGLLCTVIVARIKSIYLSNMCLLCIDLMT